MKFSEFATQYFKWLTDYRGYSGRTAENYALAYGQFRAYLSHRGLDDAVKHFCADVVQDFAGYLATANKPNSVNTKLAALGSLAKYGLRTKDKRGRYILAENPLERIERPQRQRAERKYLHRDELKALMAAPCPAGERVAIDLFLDTGLRVSELVRPDVADLWEDGAGAMVLSTTVKGRGRSQQKVDIPLAPTLGQRLLTLLREREAKPTDPLLVNQSGRRFSRTGLSEAIRRVAFRAGITRLPVRAHALRHTYNVVARSEAKLDPVQRGGLLNQTDTASVAKYDHLLPDETVEAREAVRAGMRRYAGEPESSRTAPDSQRL